MENLKQCTDTNTVHQGKLGRPDPLDILPRSGASIRGTHVDNRLACLFHALIRRMRCSGIRGGQTIRRAGPPVWRQTDNASTKREGHAFDEAQRKEASLTLLRSKICLDNWVHLIIGMTRGDEANRALQVHYYFEEDLTAIAAAKN